VLRARERFFCAQAIVGRPKKTVLENHYAGPDALAFDISGRSNLASKMEEPAKLGGLR